jgi:molybdopterin molybdotransferase
MPILPKRRLHSLGFEGAFESVDIKPGKPTTFGRIGDTLILNLPGNPLAAALCFELFGQSAILAPSADEKINISQPSPQK